MSPRRQDGFRRGRLGVGPEIDGHFNPLRLEQQRIFSFRFPKRNSEFQINEILTRNSAGEET
jgi:hypothetical protein